MSGKGSGRLHHLALGARDVEAVAAFYRAVFSLEEETRHLDDAGALRSIWLNCAGTRLMIERTEYERPHRAGVDAGAFLLAFAIEENERADFESRLAERGAPVEDRTGYTSYARDPEGNRVAVSFYPSR